MKGRATALLRARTMPFIGQKALQCDEKKRAKFSLFSRHAGERFTFK
jgi:hypothetical protein